MPDLPRITSVHNALVAELRALQSPKGRRAQGLALLEGPHLVAECLRAQVAPATVLYVPDTLRDDRLAGELLALAADGVPVSQTTPAVIARIAATRTPQAIVASVALADLAAEHLRARRRGRARPLLLILDDVSDPGNVGTILRSALAADVDEVWLTPGCADVYAPKVLRAASGAHFHLPLRPDLDWEAIAARLAGSPKVQQVVLADSGAPAEYTALDFTHRTALIVANEAHGPAPAARRLATHPARIPMYNGVESLNVAIAASVILAEAVRQRRKTELQ